MPGVVSFRWPWSNLDPSTWGDEIVSWLARQALAGLNNLWAMLGKTALITPDVTRLQQVTQLNHTSLLIVNAAYVLMIVVAGIVVMTRDTIGVRYGIADLAPRLVFGVIAANFAPFIVTHLITLANALTATVSGAGISSSDSFALLQVTVATSMKNPTDLLLSLIIRLIICGLTAALMVTWLIRIGILVILAGVGPLALACHGLPQTDPVAKLWWRSVWGCLATVVLQALVLHTSLAIFLTDGISRRQLGLGSATSSSLNLFIVVCLLWTTVKIPALMRRYVTAGGGGNAAGAVLRVVVMQQLTRGLSRAMTGSSLVHHSKRPPGRPAGGVAGNRQRPGRGPDGLGSDRAATAGRTDASGRSRRSADTGRGSRTAAGATANGTVRRAAQPRPSRAVADDMRVPANGPVRPYRADELAAGVDVYTRAQHAARAAGRSTLPSGAPAWPTPTSRRIR